MALGQKAPPFLGLGFGILGLGFRAFQLNSCEVFGGRTAYLEGHGYLVVMEKKMETTIYYLGFRF